MVSAGSEGWEEHAVRLLCREAQLPLNWADLARFFPAWPVEVLQRGVTQALARRSAVPVEPALPAWLAQMRGVSEPIKPQLLVAILDCAEAITGRRPAPDRAGTVALQILSLWRHLGRPPLEELVASVRLVARAAHECPDALFARDLRAEGWADGTNRSRSVASVLRLQRWDDRLEAATNWEARGSKAAGRIYERLVPLGP